jgi:hypothetical protein
MFAKKLLRSFIENLASPPHKLSIELILKYKLKNTG